MSAFGLKSARSGRDTGPTPDLFLLRSGFLQNFFFRKNLIFNLRIVNNSNILNKLLNTSIPFSLPSLVQYPFFFPGVNLSALHRN